MKPLNLQRLTTIKAQKYLRASWWRIKLEMKLQRLTTATLILECTYLSLCLDRYPEDDTTRSKAGISQTGIEVTETASMTPSKSPVHHSSKHKTPSIAKQRFQSKRNKRRKPKETSRCQVSWKADKDHSHHFLLTLQAAGLTTINNKPMISQYLFKCLLLPYLIKIVSITSCI